METNLSFDQLNSAELQELSQRIAKRRQELETSYGVINDLEMVKEAVVNDLQTEDKNSEVKNKPKSELEISQKSYIDSLPQDIRTKVEERIEIVFKQGLKKGINQAKKDLNPLELDAFHDLLANGLYEQLQARNLIK